MKIVMVKLKFTLEEVKKKTEEQEMSEMENIF